MGGYYCGCRYRRRQVVRACQGRSRCSGGLVNEAKENIDNKSLGVRLLADLRTVFGNKSSMSTVAILKALHALEESPWNDLKGKPLNDRGLARHLKQYGVRSRGVRVG